MNVLSRGLARLGWGRLEARWPALKTWKPVIGTVVLASAALLHVYNQHDLSKTATEVGAATGITEDAPVTAEEVAALAEDIAELVTLLTAVGVGLGGVRRKVVAEYRKRHDLYVVPRPRG